jgi:2-isopropylmalate synthase
LAVANSLEAVRAGAVQVQGTINGYGERSGNANLCTIIPTLVLKMNSDLACARSLEHLQDLALATDELVSLRPDPKAPYVGESAFGHKAGLHANAVEKNPATMEHIDPARVGNRRRILISEEAGTSSILLKAAELGVRVDRNAPEVKEALRRIKDMEHAGYSFENADASFRILVQKVLKRHRSFFDLEGFRVIVEKRGKNDPCVSEATVKVRVHGEVEHSVAEGDGPVNALDTALRRVLTRFYPDIAKVVLTDFRVRILDPQEATAAKTRVVIESGDGRETWGTVGVSGNIIEASWEALVDSVEYKLFREEEKARAKKA